MKVLLGITSSIAAYRMPNFVSQGRKSGHEFRVMVTGKALQFVTKQALSTMSQHRCYADEDEWGNVDEVLHIQLAKWCDVLMIAPLTANSLAKIANGICDNLLTCAVRALGEKPLVLAPAMNTRMWDNPLTARHLEEIGTLYNLTLIDPVRKKLADGDEGIGALADDATMLKILSELESHH